MSEEKGTITRRMESVLDDLENEFRVLYTREDFEHMMDALEAAGNRSDRPSKLKMLFRMFDKCGITYEKGKSNAYYESIVKNARLLSFSETEDHFLYALYSIYKKYPSPEDYMKRIVDRLSNKEDGWDQDPLRLRILKQFIKYGNYLCDAGYSGRNYIQKYVKEKTGQSSEEAILAGLDDQIFDVLKKATKAQKKPGGTYGLIKTADDLATGKFRAGGATKKSLYLFAMVYGMTYYSGEDNAQIVDPKTDIERNLFQDYYTNNLILFISNAYKANLSEFEQDPSGQGINYKNFAEMIYLYYISRDYTPQEKIRLSSEMIDSVGNSQKMKGKINTKEKGGTVYYRNIFTEDILSMTESEFKDFLCEHYNCDTGIKIKTKDGDKDSSIGELQMEAEQNSAFDAYQDIIRELKKCELPLENCNYGLWFTDVAAFRKKGLENICDRNKEIDREQFNEFLELLFGFNRFMGYTAREQTNNQNDKQESKALSTVKTKALYISNSNEVTRTSILVAYYYYFNAKHEKDDVHKWKSFEDVFDSFKEEVDQVLEKAYYQKLSGKSLFDVLVVFSSYAYLNI